MPLPRKTALQKQSNTDPRMARQIKPIPSGCARSRSKQCRTDTKFSKEKRNRTKQRKTETHHAASNCASKRAQKQRTVGRGLARHTSSGACRHDAGRHGDGPTMPRQSEVRQRKEEKCHPVIAPTAQSEPTCGVLRLWTSPSSYRTSILETGLEPAISSLGGRRLIH